MSEACRQVKGSHPCTSNSAALAVSAKLRLKRPWYILVLSEWWLMGIRWYTMVYDTMIYDDIRTCMPSWCQQSKPPDLSARAFAEFEHGCHEQCWGKGPFLETLLMHPFHQCDKLGPIDTARSNQSSIGAYTTRSANCTSSWWQSGSCQTCSLRSNMVQSECPIRTKLASL